jgi:UPF0716 protein FxsA
VGLYLLIAFVAAPLIEIAIFIQVGSVIGLGSTLLVIVGTAIAGAAMVRSQGLATIRSAQVTLSRGEAPLAEVFDGICLFASGLLLLTPGFATDILGGLLLIAPLRHRLRSLLVRRLLDTGSGPDNVGPRQPGRVIDAEYQQVDPDQDTAKGNKN